MNGYVCWKDSPVRRIERVRGCAALDWCSIASGGRADRGAFGRRTVRRPTMSQIEWRRPPPCRRPTKRRGQVRRWLQVCPAPRRRAVSQSRPPRTDAANGCVPAPSSNRVCRGRKNPNVFAAFRALFFSCARGLAFQGGCLIMRHFVQCFTIRPRADLHLRFRHFGRWRNGGLRADTGRFVVRMKSGV